MKFISKSEVREKLTMSGAINAMEHAFRDISSGRAVIPERLPLHSNSATEYLFMPAYYPGGRITTIKSVSINSENPSRGLPLIHATILAFDHETGQPVAMVDGGEVTAIRTAAASGLATKLLANPAAEIGAIFGTGVQARSHLEAITLVRNLSVVMIFGSSFDKAKAFCRKNKSEFEVDLKPTDDPELLGRADIICTTTTSDTPVFEHRYIKRGAHINAVGAYKADCREIPTETVKEAMVFIDQYEAALVEAGDLLIPLSKGEIDKEHFNNEIGNLVIGEINYQWSPLRTTLFKSVGNAIQDAAAVSVVIH